MFTPFHSPLHAPLTFRSLLKTVFFGVCAIALFVWLYVWLANLGASYEWQWNRVWRRFLLFTPEGVEAGPLCKGLFLSIEIVILSLCLSLVVGLALTAARLSSAALIKRFATIFISILRAVPLLFQLFIVYFLVSPIFNLGPTTTAIFTLSAFEGACFAVILEAAILAAPREQWEAAISLGFSLPQCLFWIILPQAFRNCLPSLTNQAISLIKDSSLVSAIAVAELTMRAQALVAETFLAFEVWLFVAFIYLLLSLCVSLPAILYEKTRVWK